MERKEYFLGLYGDCRLVCEREDIFYYYTKENQKKIRVIGKKGENSMTLSRNTKDGGFTKVGKKEIFKNVKRNISEDGSRWEGDWYNEKPFGFGSVYDGE